MRTGAASNTTWERRLVVLFFVSGFTGLIYESVWSRYLGLFLGHAAYAQTAVLALYMGGMALGAWWHGVRRPEVDAPLRAYAVVEGAVGVWALAFHVLYLGLTGFVIDQVYPAVPDAAVAPVKFAVAALLVVPPAVALGWSFPLMSSALLRRRPEDAGRHLAMLYFANSAGGVVGVLVSGFVLLDQIGLPATLAVAGVSNLVIARVAWSASVAETSSRPAAAPTTTVPAPAILLLVVAALTGLASFGYEVAWIRMLSLVLGSSTHSFELMLAAFISGLALGGAWVRRRIDGWTDPSRALGVVQVVMGVAALATLPAYRYSFDAVSWLVTHLPKTPDGYLGYLAGSSGIALAVMLPATFCAGMTLPLISAVMYRSAVGERAMGRVYAANAAGSIAGVFLAAHLGLPHLGVHGTLVAAASVDLAAGLALLAAAGAGARPALGVAGVVAVAAVAGLGSYRTDELLRAAGVYRIGVMPDASVAEVIYHRDGATASIAVLRYADGGMGIRTNGKTDAMVRTDGGPPSPDESTGTLLGAIPAILHPNPARVAVIGFGAGLTTEAMLCSPRVRHVETVEIEPAVIEASRHFGVRNARAYTDPRHRFVVDDAKTVFSRSALAYDVIVSEPSNPWVSGVSGLFTREFYALAKRSLAPGGLFVQWVQLYEIDTAAVASIFRALEFEFHAYDVFASNSGDIVIVARVGDEPLHLADRGAAFSEPDLAAIVAPYEVSGVEDLAGRWIGDRRLLSPLFRSFSLPANSDYLPVLERTAARSRFLRDSAEALISLPGGSVPVVEHLGARPLGAAARSPSFLRGVRETSARAVYRYVLDLPPQPGEASLDLAVHPFAVAFRGLVRDCTAPAGEERTEAVFQTLNHTVPFLDAADARALVDAVDRTPCAATWSVVEQAYVRLFAATAERDAAAMRTEAVALLAADPALTPARRAHLVAAGMLGALAAGDRGAAKALWEQHRDAVARDGQASLLLRWLTAHAVLDP